MTLFVLCVVCLLVHCQIVCLFERMSVELRDVCLFVFLVVFVDACEPVCCVTAGLVVHLIVCCSSL